MPTEVITKSNYSDFLARLTSLADEKYRAFQTKLVPNEEASRILGVRMPALRTLAKEIGRGDPRGFLAVCGDDYYEERMLRALVTGKIKPKSFEDLCALAGDMLPYVNNWAVCDGLSLPCFKKHRQDLLETVPGWLGSDHTYTIRFGIKMLMDHFLNADFRSSCLETVAAVTSEEYYVNMMIAWYFATALAKQWDAALPFLKDGRLDRWVHNKTIQKAVESYRITDTQKALLRSLRRPG